MEEKQLIPHSLTLEDRNRLTVTGVSDVGFFDDEEINAYTSLGELLIKGSELHISQLNTNTGELDIQGKVSSLIYTSESARTKGVFSRLLK